MEKVKRFIYLVILWLLIWAVQWKLQSNSINFINNNLYVFFCQIVLTALLIFYTAPTFLFKNKNVLFVLVSLVIIILFSFAPINLLNPDIKNNSNLPRPPLHLHPHLHSHQNKLSREFLNPPSHNFINFLLLTITYFLSTFLEGFIYFKKKEEEAIINKNENLETELKLLKSQINPHFLFNTLNNIYALSAIDTNKTQQSISYLSNMLRYVLYECEQKLVPIKKEILYIEDYIKLFSLKSSYKYPIKFNVNITDKNILVAPMLFLPYVENAFKHSNIESKSANSFITIDVDYIENGKIFYSVRNSIPSNKMEKDGLGGIGLINVKKRLSILYPNKHTLNIFEKDNTYNVELTIEVK